MLSGDVSSALPIACERLLRGLARLQLAGLLDEGFNVDAVAQAPVEMAEPLVVVGGVAEIVEQR